MFIDEYGDNLKLEQALQTLENDFEVTIKSFTEPHFVLNFISYTNLL